MVPHDLAQAWVREQGGAARAGTFADAADFGEVLLNCTSGIHSCEALATVAPNAVAGKLLIDVANPLDFSAGFPPRIALPDGDSLAEQIQRMLPHTLVVKALNTVTASVMVAPGTLSEPTDLFIAGDDATAKAQVVELMTTLGWSRDRVRDLGGLSAARATERYLALWLSVMGVVGSPEFNVRVVTGEAEE